MDPELSLRRKGIRNIAGVDEAGRGPLAGPVVAAAVILGREIKGIKDSKLLTARSRNKLYYQILKKARSIGISVIDNRTIDNKNILRASLFAMKQAVESLDVEPKHVLVDGNKKIPDIKMKQKSVVSGDKLCRSISAASIVAKVVRDKIMECYDEIYPQYGFNKHKGYPTKEHVKLLRKHGPASIHRLSYEPVLNCLKTRGILFI